MKRTLFRLLVFIVLMLPLAYASPLPISRSFGPFTVTVSSITFAADGRGATVYGSVQSDLWAEVHVLSAYAPVTSTQYLGRGDLQGMLVLKPNVATATSVVLSSPYTMEQLGQLNIQTVRLHAELRYCVLMGWWCVPIPYYPLPADTSIWCDFSSCTVIYDRAFSLSELTQIAQEYG
ncbi:hypothetical protein MUP07_00755 [Candidatus Bathyarchaeota archaeon]|nr:hypothetical protein [Candidatus Bathyarchaeota archaeon]